MHLGIADENLINEMSMVFFDDIIEELGHKLIYDAVVNYAGNSFFEKSWDMISEHNPFTVAEDEANGSSSRAKALANFFNNANIQIIEPEKSYSEVLKEKKERNPNGGKDQVDAGNA